MPRVRGATLALVGLLLVAGCSGTLPGGDSTTVTPTATPAPVPDVDADGATTYPPGVTAAGVVDPTRLATAHSAAVAPPYTLRSNLTVRFANGSLRGRVDQFARVTADEWTATIRVAGPRPRLVARGNATADVWSDGEVLAARARHPNRTVYLYLPSSRYDGDGFYGSLRRPKPYRDVGALAGSVAVTPVERQNGTVRLAGEELADSSLFAGATAVRNPRNVSYTLTVTRRGLVRTQRLRYEGTVDGERVSVTRTIAYRPGPVTVQRPAWVETARNESVAVTL